jgi:hypothetical protein
MIPALLFLLAQVATSPTFEGAVERLRAKTPVDAVRGASIEQLAGRYTSTSEELGKYVGPFKGGDDLYLFPDGTFVYCEWTDVSPLTVYDKGTWRIAEGLVELRSDPKVTWDPEIERRYAAIRRSSGNKEILLIGVARDLVRFEKDAGKDAGFMLLVIAKKRETTFSKEAAGRVKARLLKEAWRPEYFQEKAK